MLIKCLRCIVRLPLGFQRARTVLPHSRSLGLLKVCTQTEGFTTEPLWIFLKSVSESLFGRRAKEEKKKKSVPCPAFAIAAA